MRFQLRNAAVLGLLTFIPAAAYPCGNAVMLQTDEAARLVAKAEGDLQEGRPQKALNRLHDGDVEVDSRDLQRRIDLVTATARLRLGRVTEAAWSFDALHQQNPKDTVIETRLGETLARLGTKAGKTKALSILESLEQRDLMADEFGFLALAKLRNDAGDAAGRDRALGRCRAMAKDAAICTIEAERPKSKSRPTKKDSGTLAPTS